MLHPCHIVCLNFKINTSPSAGSPIGWRCRICRLLLCKLIRLLQTSRLDMTRKIWWWGSSNARTLGNIEYHFIAIAPRPFSWAVWHSCRMGDQNQEQTRGWIGPKFRLGNLRVGELLFQIPLHALYSTRPYGPIQAICWHTCPDLDLGPWYGLTH